MANRRLTKEIRTIHHEVNGIYGHHRITAELTAMRHMSAADRAKNIRHIGKVAKLMVDAGLVVVTAFISPFREDREQVRTMFAEGEFIEVSLDTSLAEFEKRAPKGLSRKAREGKIRDLSGIDSPYEAPIHAEIVLHTTEMEVKQCIAHIRSVLEQKSAERSSV